MNTQEQFTEGIDTSKVLKDHGGWDNFRARLCCIDEPGGENSIERLIDQALGDLGEYEQAKILAGDNPQEKIDELVKRVEKAIEVLNDFLMSVRGGGLFLNVVADDKENRYQPKLVPVAHFSLVEAESPWKSQSDFWVTPQNEEGDVITPAYKGVARASEAPMTDFLKEIMVTGPNFRKESLEAIRDILGQAFAKIAALRNTLLSTQRQNDFNNKTTAVATKMRDKMAQVATA